MLRGDITKSQELMSLAASHRSRGEHQAAFEAATKLLRLCWRDPAAYLGRAGDAFAMGFFPVVRHDAGVVLELTRCPTTECRRYHNET